jgi:hypothetical protein
MCQGGILRNSLRESELRENKIEKREERGKDEGIRESLKPTHQNLFCEISQINVAKFGCPTFREVYR